ncbi:MAG: alpha/beta hydrolase family protein [Planctomycetota bacterium]|jgi:predicted dienelactone hydrolase
MVSILSISLILSILSTTFCGTISVQDSPYSARGSKKVILVNTIKLVDKARGKEIEALVRYPDDVGTFPIIIFSHGSFSNKETFDVASEHWASHGYVVIHPNHADARSGTGGMGRSRFGREQESGGSDEGKYNATNTDKQAKRRGAGLVIGGFGGATSNAARVERIKDISSVLDSLDQVEKQIPSLKGRLNRDAIAVVGHSYGAYVAQCHGGVKTLVNGKLENLSDPRVKCVIPISAQGESESYGLTAESWTDASTPAMHITGTRDRSAPDRPGGQFGDVTTKVVPFERSPRGGKYLLVIEGATHVSFGGKIGRVRGGVDAAGLTKSVSLAFLDAYLKQDVQAKAWLNGQPSTAWLGSQAKLQRKL